jgi:hypothetical protein
LGGSAVDHTGNDWQTYLETIGVATCIGLLLIVALIEHSAAIVDCGLLAPIRHRTGQTPAASVTQVRREQAFWSIFPGLR